MSQYGKNSRKRRKQIRDKRREHASHWEFQVTKLAILDPKLHEACRLKVYGVIPTWNPGRYISPFRDALVKLFPESATVDGKQERYLALAFKRVTPRPAEEATTLIDELTRDPFRSLAISLPSATASREMGNYKHFRRWAPDHLRSK